MKRVNLHIRTYLDILLFLLLVTIKVLLYGKQMESGYFSYFSLFSPVFASILIIIAISLLFSNSRRVKFLYLCNIIITLFIIGDLTYFRYFKDVISIPVLINGLQLGAVKSSVSTLIRLSDFLYALDIILIFPILIKFKYANRFELSRTLKLSLFFILLIFSFSINAKSFYDLSKDQPRLLTTFYNRVYIVKRLGFLNYHYLDLYNSLNTSISKNTPVSKKKENEIKTFLQSNSQDTSNLKGIVKGKNLIMIQVEALQGFVINSKVEGSEITPNLNKYTKNSIYFDNFYYQISAGGTSDAEFMSNNSLYPAVSGAACFMYCGNEFNAMPKSFGEAGYETSAFHGFRESFWNRNVIYKKYGFNNFYGEKSYNIDENIGLGLSDKSFLSQSVDKIKELNEPYYAFLITLSSHFPFDDVNNYGDLNVGQYENTLLGDYLKAIHYTDAQLGMFFDKLEKEGILKDSVVVLYGDHYAIPKDHVTELAKFLNKDSLSDLEYAKLQKVPMLIHFPDESNKGVNSIPGGQMDIYPTLCNLFDLPSKDLMGKDLFNPKDESVIFRDSSFIDGKYYYMSQTNNYFDMSTGQKIDENEDLKSKKENALNQLEYSDEILKHNLFKKFGKEN
ncbi:LTA synthase family protein [Clostridiaceae bacterium UIB06]|uniref:LTA synthase family protein n=1 Tax=Clostridium thailandense TaxID=2794346 RepID=A0A949WY46_9CLOT|nr:LTA synthase family protein [Clostridium thailandense]MBV7276697.1 LTA synthase family protein [Clostridium thailandense]MCH5135639.1 LTA synthase family protein [Clostridiaceae bacterium UIB06]